MADNNGTLRKHTSYDSFGKLFNGFGGMNETHYNAAGSVVTIGQPGYVQVTFGFTGRYFDLFTGLQNNLHRWYDASVGRWLSENPLDRCADWHLKSACLGVRRQSEELRCLALALSVCNGVMKPKARSSIF
ncbi:MAG: RHS repeat-associated core domain-containing protein [Pirellulales bacterium]